MIWRGYKSYHALHLETRKKVKEWWKNIFCIFFFQKKIVKVSLSSRFLLALHVMGQRDRKINKHSHTHTHFVSLWASVRRNEYFLLPLFKEWKPWGEEQPPTFSSLSLDAKWDKEWEKTKSESGVVSSKATLLLSEGSKIPKKLGKQRENNFEIFFETIYFFLQE
jgi:hypothetical protein